MTLFGHPPEQGFSLASPGGRPIAATSGPRRFGFEKTAALPPHDGLDLVGGVAPAFEAHPAAAVREALVPGDLVVPAGVAVDPLGHSASHFHHDQGGIVLELERTQMGLELREGAVDDLRRRARRLAADHLQIWVLTPAVE